MKRLLIPLLGGVIGFCAETVHRRAGVWTLPEDGPMPLWVALVYALGIALLWEGFRRFERGRPPLKSSLAGETALLTLLFLLPPLLHRHEWLLLAMATGFVTARLLLARAPGDLAVVVAVAAADLLLEWVLVEAGLYRYSHARLALPLWLASLWGGMALSLRRIFKSIS